MKNDARKLSPETQEEIRRKAVAAVENGMTRVAAAEVFGVTRHSVDRWVQAFREKGAKALARQKRGPRSESRSLNNEQGAEVVKLITDREPEQLKLPFALWTRDAVRTLIRRKFGVRVSLSTVGRYLARWGFSPQKPVRRAYEQNPEAVERWLNEEYPGIRKRSKTERALIYWGDEMGMRSDHQAGRSYAPKGKTPAIAGTGQRFRCNMISALTNRGHLSFMIFKKGFTSAIFIRFLRRLTKDARRKVFLIVDGHPVHKSKKVRQWLSEHAEEIELFLLPGYSPELNPDEMLNQDVKTNAVGRKRSRTLRQMMGQIRRYLERRRAMPEIVKRYFNKDSLRYAAF